MKALHLAATLTLGLISAGLNTAQAGDGGGANGGSKAVVVRRDLVGPDFRPATSGTILLMREVRKTSNGFEVKVKAADGSLRMRGVFSDEQLTQANGLFSFYHDNGRLESEGHIANGVKTGVWKRYDRGGAARGEKIYNGQTYDQMAVSNGWSAPQN